ncbi:MAG: hypothetical protein BGO55_07870 [Sphingobacteriales bacterium 50-39]|nr:hypothetical protein [Sphingobacteriales bacterium]OJW53156.1 MAG: hypothetical protein BGO55_07870 [Sphingobacteriales bacterium 50-39]
MLKRFSKILILLLGSAAAFAQQSSSLREKTSFQISAPWKAEYDVRSDIAMVYGVSNDFEERVKAYRDNGYNVQFMTGIAWGDYQDYFLGRYDGKMHLDEGQKQRNGDTIWHGHWVPYIVPTASYLGYMKSIIKRVIDAGITTIYLEEPEFWARAGYSEAFKSEWQKYYGSPWVAQHESPEATYLSSKLKYHLYYNALNEVFTYAKQYGKEKGLSVRCFVPTHSLINYSSWQIVSPEASLASLPVVDGYIAQVWTGTSREPVFFDGKEKERVFENAYLEYGCMKSMTEPTHRKMYFLTDPIEDARRSWDDYKRNYQATFTAELMYPSVDNFEVMPWPNRIYLGKFKVEGFDKPQPIAPEYATQMQVMVNSLNDLPSSTNAVRGSKGVGVLLSNSMMFQRFPTHKDYSDPQLSNFYGMALPLLKRGVPVEMVHMENLSFPETLKDIKVLVMSYANMKPPTADVHRWLNEWVRKGGILLYYGRDNDPLQQVKEWWNSGGNSFTAPSEHLFGLLGVRPDERTGPYTLGKGKIYIVRQDPKEIVMTQGQDSGFVRLVREAYATATHAPLRLKNYLYLERGPYTIAAVMDESVSDAPLTIKGPVIDLFDPNLPVLSEKIVHPGEQTYLYALERVNDKRQARVLCAASRTYDEKRSTGSYSFVSRSPLGTRNVMRILLPSRPMAIEVGGVKLDMADRTTHEWDVVSHTCLLRFVNDNKGVSVKITY